MAAPAENGEEGSHNEAAEARELRDLAKIDRSEAEKAALQAVPGTAESARLEEENGYVVYEVEVVGDDGQDHHVDVDAGDGKVLQQNTGEGGGDEPGESGEGGEQQTPGADRRGKRPHGRRSPPLRPFPHLLRGRGPRPFASLKF